MKIVGKFLGKDKDYDKTIWESFKGHQLHFFSNIPDRTNFVRQEANLHMVKYLLQNRLAIQLSASSDILHIMGGLFMRKFSKTYGEEASRHARNDDRNFS